MQFEIKHCIRHINQPKNLKIFDFGGSRAYGFCTVVVVLFFVFIRLICEREKDNNTQVIVVVVVGKPKKQSKETFGRRQQDWITHN